MKEQIIGFVSDAISVPADDIRKNPSSYGLGATVSWDSLVHLAIMTELEEILGEEISIEEMEELKDMQTILDRVNRGQ